MKSIDQLRNRVTNGTFSSEATKDLFDIADEIEAEIADNYMLLPVDADGVPIHVGDICEWNGDQFEVRQLKTDGDYWWAIDRLGEFCMAKDCRHVKPRTLEDVLREFASKKIRIHRELNEYSTSADDDAIAKYADEIRDIFCGGCRRR